MAVGGAVYGAAHGYPSWVTRRFHPLRFAIPKHKNEEGETEEVSVVVHPTGLPNGESVRRISVRLSYTLDEAEELARLILETVENARAGKFDEIGIGLTAGESA